MYNNLYTPIRHLLKPEVKPGGLCWIVFARRQDVQQWPAIDPATGLAYTAIKLKPGATWYYLKVVDNDRFFREDPKDTSAGTYWEQTVSGYFGGNNSTHILTFAALAFDEVAVMLNDRDGNIRLIGCKEAAAKVRSPYNSGHSNSSRKRDVIIDWEHLLPAPIYIGTLDPSITGVIDPPFAGQGDFSEDFNEDFNI